LGYAKAVVLICPESCSEDLSEFVETCLRDGVVIICAMGPNARHIEDVIDWIIVGDGSDHSRFILTSSHVDGSMDDVMDFAKIFVEDLADQSIQVIELE
jgi:hypothetical protein